MFPTPKSEEGLSSQFQQIDRNNQLYNNGFGQNAIDESQDDKKAKSKKKTNGAKPAGGAAATNDKSKNGKAGGQVFEVPSTSSK